MDNNCREKSAETIVVVGNEPWESMEVSRDSEGSNLAVE